MDPLDFISIFTHFPGAALLVSPDSGHTILAVNDAYLAATHTTRQQLLGIPLFQAFSDNPTDPNATGVQNLRASLDHVLRTRGPHTMPTQRYDIRSPDGSFEERHWKPTNTPILSPDGQTLTAILHHVQDVTDLIRLQRAEWSLVEQIADADRERLASEQRFRHMADAIPHIVWITDADGRALFFNRHWHDLTGVPDTSTTAAEISATLLHPDDGPATIAAFNDSRAAEKTFQVEHRIRSRTGEYRWYLASGEPYRDPVSGKITRWYGTSIDIHDGKRAEEKLKAQSLLTQTVANNAAEALYLLSAEGLVTFANPAAENMFGFSADEMRGKLLHDLIHYMHPDGSPFPMSECAVGQCFFTGKTLRNHEDTFIHRNGTFIPVLCSMAPIIQDGTNFGSVLAVMDVTERKRAEERLRLEQVRQSFLLSLGDTLRTLSNPAEVTATAAKALGQHLRVARAGYAELDAAQSTVTVERDWTSGPLSSLAGDSRPPDSFGPLINAELHAGRTLRIDDVATDPRSAPYALGYSNIGARSVLVVPLIKENRLTAVLYLHESHPRRWTDDDVLLAEEVAQRTWAALGRARAESALKVSERRFREIADAMPQIVWAAEPNGLADYYNKRWYEYTGQDLATPVPFSNETWQQVMHPDSLPIITEAWFDSVRSGQPYTAEARLRRHDGEYRWHLIRALPIRDENGEVVRWFGTDTDIHDQKLTEQALAEARAQAESASRAKDRFLAVLSHELRTPLTPVAMTATAMEMDPALPFAFREDVAMIRRNVELETRLIDDLLDLSRVISGKLRLSRQPVHVHHIVSHVLETVGAELHEKQLVTITDLQAKNDLVDADPARLQQALWNLLKNAGKFTPPDGQIIVSTHNPSPDFVDIQITDTGQGISSEILPRIFDPFEQGSEETTRRHGGMGLGLAIAKAVVDLHGGTIQAASLGPNQGATFIVSLPTLARPLSSLLPNIASPSSAPLPPRTLPRLLLVEDHPDTSRILARLLRNAGYEVTIAHSVAQALSALNAQPPSEPFDALLSDIGLPDGTGHDLLLTLRKSHPNLPAIAMSGFGMEDDLRRSAGAGFAEHLIKPVTLSHLTSALSRLLPAPPHDNPA